MIRLAVMYPYKEGARFDHSYYAKMHMELVRRAFAGYGLQDIRVDKGVHGGSGKAPPVYIGVGVLTFDTMENYQSAFRTHGKALMADLPNFTDIEPVIQVSEVVL